MSSLRNREDELNQYMLSRNERMSGNGGYVYRGESLRDLNLDITETDHTLQTNILTYLVQKAVFQQDYTFLDLGAGNGQLSRLVSRGARLKGSHINATSVSLVDMRTEKQKVQDARLHVQYVVQAAEQFLESTPENSVHFMNSRHLFQHLYDPILILQQMFRATQPGGEIFLT